MSAHSRNCVLLRYYVASEIGVKIGDANEGFKPQPKTGKRVKVRRTGTLLAFNRAGTGPDAHERQTESTLNTATASVWREGLMNEIRVTRLYRFPVKSMTPERVSRIELTSDGRIQGDRVLGFRFRNAGGRKDWSWQTKQNYVGLVNTPGLARLTVEYDLNTKYLRISEKGMVIAEGGIEDGADRFVIEEAFSDYVSTLDINPIANHRDRQPACLVGDGEQPLFHDTAAGLVTLHSEESLGALADAIGDETLNGLRFRSNIVVSGVPKPFSEMSWVGKRVYIGQTEFKITKSVNRCLVTHANPITGVRDYDIMNTLVTHFTPERPQFAVMLEAVSGPNTVIEGEVVSVGD